MTRKLRTTAKPDEAEARRQSLEYDFIRNVLREWDGRITSVSETAPIIHLIIEKTSLVLAVRQMTVAAARAARLEVAREVMRARNNGRRLSDIAVLILTEEGDEDDKAAELEAQGFTTV